MPNVQHSHTVQRRTDRKTDACRRRRSSRRNDTRRESRGHQQELSNPTSSGRRARRRPCRRFAQAFHIATMSRSTRPAKVNSRVHLDRRNERFVLVWILCVHKPIQVERHIVLGVQRMLHHFGTPAQSQHSKLFGNVAGRGGAQERTGVGTNSRLSRHSTSSSVAIAS